MTDESGLRHDKKSTATARLELDAQGIAISSVGSIESNESPARDPQTQIQTSVCTKVVYHESSDCRGLLATGVQLCTSRLYW